MKIELNEDEAALVTKAALLMGETEEDFAKVSALNAARITMDITDAEKVYGPEPETITIEIIDRAVVKENYGYVMRYVSSAIAGYLSAPALVNHHVVEIDIDDEEDSNTVATIGFGPVGRLDDDVRTT